MPIIKQIFRRYKLETEVRDEQPFTLRLTDKDKVWFEPAQKFINQPKRSTAMKQLAEIGAIMVLQDLKIAKILDVIKGNSYRNKKIGLSDIEFKEHKIDEILTKN